MMPSSAEALSFLLMVVMSQRSCLAGSTEDASIECDVVPDVTDAEMYEESCVKKNLAVIVMKKNIRSARIMNAYGQDRNFRPGPYYAEVDYYDIDSDDYYDDASFYEDEEYFFEDDEDRYGYLDLFFDIFF